MKSQYRIKGNKILIHCTKTLGKIKELIFVLLDSLPYSTCTSVVCSISCFVTLILRARIVQMNKIKAAVINTESYAETCAFNDTKAIHTLWSRGLVLFITVLLAILKTLLSVILVRIVPNTAIPKAHATLRASASTEDAIPISWVGTTTAMILVRCAIQNPNQNAIRESGSMMSSAVDRGSRKENQYRAIEAISVLSAITYRGSTFPVNLPPSGAPNIIAKASGIKRNPVCVASYPRNVCANTGMRKILPISPINTTKLFINVFTKAGILKNLKSTIGSGWLRSITINKALNMMIAA